MTKVTLFKLKNNKELYAYSINKEYIKLFKEQRNMNLFDKYDVEMDKYELMIFTNKYKSYQLVKDYLYDGQNDIEIVASVSETSALTESCDDIYNTACTIDEFSNDYPLKQKYLNIISVLTDSITLCDEKSKSLNINTFKLFYHLFRNTFSEDGDRLNEIL